MTEMVNKPKSCAMFVAREDRVARCIEKSGCRVGERDDRLTVVYSTDGLYCLRHAMKLMWDMSLAAGVYTSIPDMYPGPRRACTAVHVRHDTPTVCGERAGWGIAKLDDDNAYFLVDDIENGQMCFRHAARVCEELNLDTAPDLPIHSDASLNMWRIKNTCGVIEVRDGVRVACTRLGGWIALKHEDGSFEPVEDDDGKLCLHHAGEYCAEQMLGGWDPLEEFYRRVGIRARPKPTLWSFLARLWRGKAA